MANQPHPDTVPISVRVHRDVDTRLRREAAARGVTRAGLIRVAIERELNASEEKAT